jgi:hypothetical protein
MQQKIQVSCNCECLCTSHKFGIFKKKKYHIIMLFKKQLDLTFILYYIKKVYILHYTVRLIMYSKITFILQEICNNILILLCNQPKPSAGSEQDNKRKYTSVHKAARTMWLQAVWILLYQLLYNARLVDISAHESLMYEVLSVTKSFDPLHPNWRMRTVLSNLAKNKY